MAKTAIIIHGGALGDSEFIRQNQTNYENAMKLATEQAFALLESGKSAVDAVEAAINFMENHELFNAGRGSALNAAGRIQMDASIMNGEDCSSGAVALLEQARNPVSVARLVMEETKSVLLGGAGAIEFAKAKGVALEEEAYFITDRQKKEYEKKCKTVSADEIAMLRNHGTVGAVALDKKGNIASGTSTGGTVFNQVGRIGDSPLIGSGCYADNKTCGVSGTGDGEYLIRSLAAGYVSVLMEQTNLSIQQACDYVVHEKNKDIEGDLGLISIDADGNFGISFNSEVMHRAWISTGKTLEVKIYKD
jgi:beta-aspartyl-peptidase (threonine type)